MNMNITLNIVAPEICESINSLVKAIVGMNGNQVVNIDQAPITRKPRATKQVDAVTASDPVVEVAETLPESVVIEKVAESIKAEDVVSSVTVTASEPAKDAPQLTLEEVRGKLATLSAAGHAPKIKELFAKFGAKKLTEVPADKYSELMIAAEAIG